jgi:hypothetical protein
MMISKLYIIFFVMKKVCTYVFNFTKFVGTKRSVARLGVYIFSKTLSKDTCSNKLGLSKITESKLGIFHYIILNQGTGT